ncbi:ATP-NAD kinase-like domain-containing protein [Jimgerdemannia flammicorona]|uniref:diacylglycerol kinase (ATP) n=1 Tax=Jimgerdemannia flammicorona TaxID=994334 RepID=A0A433D2G9_9FUNG|nr:ATP-NAD kinase-like domain-containing protein [Jimgerdemannia flammicorona]
MDRIDDTPSVYVFIFANPLSGDQKGRDLTDLHVQNFRLKDIPEVQMQIFNVLDDEDREKGFAALKAAEKIIEEEGPIMPESNEIGEAAKKRQIHVWSAGGDGTVMSVFEEMVKHQIDMNKVFFSCIPFGTGNDFSQVLGWGRTIPNKSVLGERLSELARISKERLNGEAARLDIWELELSCYETGYIRKAGKSHRNEVDERVIVRKFSNYLSIGVQGWVGSGFENQRTGTRKWNALIYVVESLKWMLFRGFPPVTRVLDGITVDGKKVLYCPAPVKSGGLFGKAQKGKIAGDNKVNGEKIHANGRAHNQEPGVMEGPAETEVPTLQKHPIDLVIQNIPHIWGREIDMWGQATSGEEVVNPRSGPTDPANWEPQRANDGRLEVFCISNVISYLKKLANIRDHVSRIGQFQEDFQLDFRRVEQESRGFRRPFWKEKDPSDPSTICIMCDGEFYECKGPKTLRFRRYAQITTLGKNPESSRLVTDEQAR